ncbi:MAG: peptidoglycan DD-metalloendopeptidase family protein, partial [Rhodobacter sp.]|nr:peptidoglycan DD-metalloendopeptidase family protein [Rhodobacter sp.]
MTQAPGGSTSHNGELYYGWDFALTSGSTLGANVLAVADGTIVFIEESVLGGAASSGLFGPPTDAGPRDPSLGPPGALGNVVTIEHNIGGQTFYSSYLHLAQNSVPVNVGDAVVAGQVIGQVGNTGVRDGTHLHLNIGETLGSYTNSSGTSFSHYQIAEGADDGGTLLGLIDFQDSPRASGELADLDVFASSTEITTSARLIDLANISPNDGFKIQGHSKGDQAGYSVSSVADVNGDGIDDVIVGAVNSTEGGTIAGGAYVIFGKSRAVRIDIDLSFLSADDGFFIQGGIAGDQAGFNVSSAGDINGDGVDDLIVGAIGGSKGGVNAGEAYVVYGKDGATRPDIDLASLFVSDGFFIQGDMANDQSARSVSSAGDINGDGIDDLIIGAAGVDVVDQEGAAYVIFGKDQGTRGNIDLSSMSGSDGFVIRGDNPGDQVGWSVSSAGDINSDGIDDLIVGAPGRDIGGAAYVLFGKAGSTRDDIELSSLAAIDGFVITGEIISEDVGWSVSSAGDVNGDGVDDLIVGALDGFHNGVYVGEAHVIFGKAGATRLDIDLSSLSPGDGFSIHGKTDDHQLGQSVSAAGDVNGDGIDDLIIGGDPFVGGNRTGEAYVIFGVQGATRADIDISVITPEDGFIIRGEADFDSAGKSVSAAGDINGDGFDDVIIGANLNDQGGTNAGAAYVIYGHADIAYGPRIPTDSLSDALAVELSHLAAAAYNDKTDPSPTADAEARGWVPIDVPGYGPINSESDFFGLLDNNIHFYEAYIDGKRTLAIAYSGTQVQGDGLGEKILSVSDFVRQTGNWDQIYQAQRGALLAALNWIADAASRGEPAFEQTMVTGHSLGGILVEELLADRANLLADLGPGFDAALLNDAWGVTFGSPGSSAVVENDARLINFVTIGDPIAMLHSESLFGLEAPSGDWQDRVKGLLEAALVVEKALSNPLGAGAQLFSEVGLTEANQFLSRDGTTVTMLPRSEDSLVLDFESALLGGVASLYVPRHFTDGDSGYIETVSRLSDFYQISDLAQWSSYGGWNFTEDVDGLEFTIQFAQGMGLEALDFIWGTLRLFVAGANGLINALQAVDDFTVNVVSNVKEGVQLVKDGFNTALTGTKNALNDAFGELGSRFNVFYQDEQVPAENVGFGGGSVIIRLDIDPSSPGFETITSIDGEYDLTRFFVINTPEGTAVVYSETPTITGTFAGDYLIGSGNTDLLRGFDGEDYLLALSGGDELRGGRGDDILIGGPGGDTLNGGGGTDAASYVGATARVVADLAVPGGNEGDAAGDSYISIENLTGTGFNDNLRGDGDANQLEGGLGNDILLGRAGDDILIGGPGGDTLNGGGGTDAASYVGATARVVADLAVPGGNAGDAAGDSYISIENLTGTGFNDNLRGDGDANQLEGGLGNDILLGRAGDDILIGGPGGDTLNGGGGTDAAS